MADINKNNSEKISSEHGFPYEKTLLNTITKNTKETKVMYLNCINSNFENTSSFMCSSVNYEGNKQNIFKNYGWLN